MTTTGVGCGRGFVKNRGARWRESTAVGNGTKRMADEIRSNPSRQILIISRHRVGNIPSFLIKLS